ncbi:MAG: hypothetical protein IT381_19580 [Deltaproteobacteria bacterium]|nr:hypothetical protein [Deltaproteobacteria bacterium]
MERKRRGFFATNRRLIITRQGKIFVGITLALGLGVLNSGNNLLFLCLGLLLSIITVSGILSEWNVRDLKLDMRTETLAIATRPHIVEFTVTNTHERRDAFSLVMEVSFHAKSAWSEDTEPVLLKKRVTIVHVPKNEQRSIRGEVIFDERGDYEIDEVSMETEYPFGLFRKIRVFLPSVKLTVAPAPQELSDALQLPPTAIGAHTRQKPGHAIEPYDVREAQPDEDIRNIAWGKSAGRQNMVAIRRATDASDAVIVGVRGEAGDEAFERALEKAAGCVVERMRAGAPTGLFLGDATAPISTGAAHERALLTMLGQTAIGAKGSVPPPNLGRAPVVWVDG